jgi:hypothetical protein
MPAAKFAGNRNPDDATTDDEKICGGHAHIDRRTGGMSGATFYDSGRLRRPTETANKAPKLPVRSGLVLSFHR